MDPQKTPLPTDERQEFHPDVTITPRAQQPDGAFVAPADPNSPALPAPTTDPNAPAAPPPASPVSTVSPATAPTPARAPLVAQPPQPEQEEDSFYNDQDGDSTQPEQPLVPATGLVTPAGRDTGNSVTWTASEFIAHEKSPLWYATLLGIGLVLAGLAYLISREIFATGVAVVVVIMFAIGAARKPRQLQYTIDDEGLTIGNRHYPYNLFRSYAVDVEDTFHSINFMPLKRFMPVISVYYDLNDEDKIADVLTAHLPLDTHKPDLIEKLMRQIRF